MCCKLLCHCPNLNSIIIDILFPASLSHDGSIYTRKGTKATGWGLTHSMLIMQILLFKMAFLLCFVKVKWLQTQEFYKHQENHIKIFCIFHYYLYAISCTSFLSVKFMKNLEHVSRDTFGTGLLKVYQCPLVTLC